MHCPSCHLEYRDGFTACADCGTPLAPGPPPEPEQPSSAADGVVYEVADLVPVLHTDDVFEADIAVSILAGEGIQAVARSWTPGGLFGTSIEGATFPVQPAAVCVPRPFVAEAREVLAAMLDRSRREAPPPTPAPIGPSAIPGFSRAKLVALALLLPAVLFIAAQLVGAIKEALR